MPNKILIIGPAWIGDMVMAQSFLTLLKQKYPGVVLHVMAPASTYPLLQFMPQVNKAILFETQHGKLDFWKRVQFGRSLRSEKYDQAILLTNSLKSAIIPFFAAIPVRTGWVGEQRFILLNDRRKLDKVRYPLMHQRFAMLGVEKGIELPELSYPKLSIARHCEELLRRSNPDSPEGADILDLDCRVASPLAMTATKILALCPGAEYGPAKRWPAEYYAEVARQKIVDGWQVWLFGSAKEKEAGDIIQEKTKGACLNLIGKTSLVEAINLLSLTDYIVCNDSGLMHIAAALDKPLIAIFGSSDPTHTPPLSDKAKIVYLKLECSPCFERICPLKHLNCLKKIEPETVLEKLS
jgi:heptosyltransferase-2